MACGLFARDSERVDAVPRSSVRDQVAAAAAAAQGCVIRLHCSSHTKPGFSDETEEDQFVKTLPG